MPYDRPDILGFEVWSQTVFILPFGLCVPWKNFLTVNLRFLICNVEIIVPVTQVIFDNSMYK